MRRSTNTRSSPGLWAGVGAASFPASSAAGTASGPACTTGLQSAGTAATRSPPRPPPSPPLPLPPHQDPVLFPPPRPPLPGWGWRGGGTRDARCPRSAHLCFLMECFPSEAKTVIFGMCFSILNRFLVRFELSFRSKKWHFGGVATELRPLMRNKCCCGDPTSLLPH